MQIPTDYLSENTKEYRKKVERVSAIKEFSSVVFEIFLSNDTEQRIRRGFKKAGNRSIIKCGVFPTGELVGVSYFYMDWENADITLKGDGRVNDLMVSHLDPLGVGRPIKLIQNRERKAGDNSPLHLIEFGAYAEDSDLYDKRENDERVNFVNPSQKFRSE
ncbi:MAG: hypothetical protein KTR16_01990 [Acidiferrobacterales bacterium]|nr:hypothetical protein [Acidiferrobacterales bacterium]